MGVDAQAAPPDHASIASMHDRPRGEAVDAPRIRESAQPRFARRTRFGPVSELHVLAIALDFVARIDVRADEFPEDQVLGA